MIIQKLVSAIRRQDWFQVLVEVLIVIVGIFLGLQVQTWYEALEDRRQEAFYLALLHDEVDRLKQNLKIISLTSTDGLKCWQAFVNNTIKMNSL